MEPPNVVIKRKTTPLRNDGKKREKCCSGKSKKNTYTKTDEEENDDSSKHVKSQNLVNSFTDHGANRQRRYIDNWFLTPTENKQTKNERKPTTPARIIDRPILLTHSV